MRSFTLQELKGFSCSSSKYVSERDYNDAVAGHSADKTEISTLRIHLKRQDELLAGRSNVIKSLEKNISDFARENDLLRAYGCTAPHAIEPQKWMSRSGRVYNFDQLTKTIAVPTDDFELLEKQTIGRDYIARDTVEVTRSFLGHLQAAPSLFRKNIAAALGAKEGDDIVSVAEGLKVSVRELKDRNDWQVKNIRQSWDNLDAAKGDLNRAQVEIARLFEQISAARNVLKPTTGENSPGLSQSEQSAVVGNKRYKR